MLQEHAYFGVGSGLNHEEIAGALQNLQEQTTENRKQTELALEKQNATFKLIANATDVQVPRAFVVLPLPSGQKKWRDPSRLFKNKFKLHLLCEYGTFHFTDDPGYEIAQLKPFLEKAAPYVGWVLGALQVLT
mmetsp:Transcript_4184/g.9071  ORF Transcript_4184/g.9071 Transcript_4184/m.9071 type:complete len:133 (-) Transcript_4184:46-444(-)